MCLSVGRVLRRFGRPRGRSHTTQNGDRPEDVKDRSGLDFDDPRRARGHCRDQQGTGELLGSRGQFR